MWSYLKDFVSQWKIKMKSNADGKSIFVNRFVFKIAYRELIDLVCSCKYFEIDCTLT